MIFRPRYRTDTIATFATHKQFECNDAIALHIPIPTAIHDICAEFFLHYTLNKRRHRYAPTLWSFFRSLRGTDDH